MVNTWICAASAKHAGERATATAIVEAEAREKEEQAFEGVWVMMNGLPGKMGYDVAAACLRKGFRVAPYALTGGSAQMVEVTVDDQEVIMFLFLFCRTLE